MNLIETYNRKKSLIEKRLQDFKNNYKKPDEELFAELCFCLLTPQSRAKLCWRAIELLKDKNLLLNGDEKQIKPYLNCVRFGNNKAKYIADARDFFSDNNKIKIKEKLNEFNNMFGMRTFLVKNVKGYGMKEASHFLRNIGFYEDIAILDRHVLKNLVKHGAIKEIPKTITPKKYIEIENQMRSFAANINIPLSHLDLLFWSEETGEIFK